MNTLAHLPEPARLPASLRALLAGAIDYAGLFPPARQSMEQTVRQFVGYKEGVERWALGRLIVPAAHWREFVEARRAHPKGGNIGPVALVVGSGSELLDLDERWLERETKVDTIEVRFNDFGELEEARWPARLRVFIEVAPGEELENRVQQVARRGAHVKIRTGGLTAAAFPPPQELAAFLLLVARIGVPWKATAGLHHALRGTHAPDAGQPPCLMHGVINFLLAAAWTYAAARGVSPGAPQSALVELLEERDASAFQFDDAGATWRNLHLSTPLLRQARQDFPASFGSCSFIEPLAECALLFGQEH